MYTICITGASSGIGEALAYHYASPQTTLLLIGRNTQRLSQVQLKCQSLGADVETAQIDVRDHKLLSTFLVESDKKHSIDLLIANAGPSLKQASGESIDYFAAQRAMVDIHITGTFNSIYPILQRMQARQSGQIAIMSSMNAKIFLPGRSIYGAVKAAVFHFGLSLRQQVRSDHVKVNVICPGWVKTPRTDLNQFSMPFKVSAKTAARIIKNGLTKNKAVIQFPWQLTVIIKMYNLLPLFCQEWISHKLYFAQSKDND